MTAPHHCAHLHGRPELPARAYPVLPVPDGCTADCGTTLYGREVLRRPGPFGGLRALCGPRGRLVLKAIALIVGGTGMGRTARR
jgi:hypothetical protein